MFAILRRGLIALLALSVLTLSPATGTPTVAQSSENARYAAIVVDAATGEVLFSRYADSRRYPASITKMMTLYMAFEALSEGRVKLDDVITVSPRAASQPPSKLGLAAGQTITLDDAMHATAVRSANDMAVAIAEHIGGTEARFTALMTLKAEELGMTQTRYVNPNGLPDSRQLTTARDLSILARAVMRDYPQYYRYFGFHDWSYQGRQYRNTNGLLATGQGYDGMKTGYTNASGYNLAASAVRDGRRLITIVLGGRSTASRNAHVAELMDTGFELERLRDRGQTIQVAQTFFEQRGFGLSTDNSEAVVYASADNVGDNVEATAVAYTPPACAAPRPGRADGRAGGPGRTGTGTGSDRYAERGATVASHDIDGLGPPGPGRFHCRPLGSPGRCLPRRNCGRRLAGRGQSPLPQPVRHRRTFCPDGRRLVPVTLHRPDGGWGPGRLRRAG